MARLSREDRRAQLLELGRARLAEVAVDQLSTDDIADEAGISRGLLFHYFATKHDYLVALAESFAADLLAATAPTLDDDPLLALRQGLSRYLAFLAEHERAYQSLLRGAAGGRAEMQDVVERTRAVQVERLLTGAGIDPLTASPRQHYAVRGFLAAVEEVSMLWLERQDVAAEALIDILVDSAAAQLVQLVAEEVPA